MPRADLLHGLVCLLGWLHTYASLACLLVGRGGVGWAGVGWGGGGGGWVAPSWGLKSQSALTMLDSFMSLIKHGHFCRITPGEDRLLVLDPHSPTSRPFRLRVHEAEQSGAAIWASEARALPKPLGLQRASQEMRWITHTALSHSQSALQTTHTSDMALELH